MLVRYRHYYRIGLAGYFSALHLLCGQLIGLPPKAPISQAAINLIVSSEVTSQSAYNRLYIHPTWPGGDSGGTVGIGEDLGYDSRPVILSDWRRLRSDWRNDLTAFSGVCGVMAKPLVQQYSFISIDWDLANQVFKETTLARYWQQTLKAFPGVENLCPNARGALESLVFNRGGSMIGPSRLEMRNIRALVPKKDYEGIAANLRAMARLWEGRGLDGLIARRYAEADLVLTCTKN